MNKETKARIEDFFTAAELVEYLQLSVEDITAAFEDEIDEAVDDINELMGINEDE